MVLQNLVAVDLPSNLPKFWGTKDKDPSRHMERYIKRSTSSLITDPKYWLVWFPTTLEGEAYEWYRDHVSPIMCLHSKLTLKKFTIRKNHIHFEQNDMDIVGKLKMLK